MLVTIGIKATSQQTRTTPPAASAVSSDAAVIRQFCAGTCHSDRMKSGELSLAGFDPDHPEQHPDIAEKVIRKLRAGLMPPPGARRPDEATLGSLVAMMETTIDERAKEPPPGRRSFQRLNRAEYARSVHDLLALDVNAGDYLPLDPKSANFDNIADAQLLSPTLMQAYLTAAAEISRLAVGDPAATARESTYMVSRWTSQREHVEGAPYGTRGGLSVMHTFPADGDYRFRVSFYHETTGALFGNGRAALHTAEAPEQIELSIDGERAALLDIDRWMTTSDPDGVNLRTNPIRITAGPHRVSAAFIRRFEGPVQDLIAPLEWSLASTSIADAYGFTTLPHLRDMAITGPLAVTGVSETPSRAKIFTCQPGAGTGAAHGPGAASTRAAHGAAARERSGARPVERLAAIQRLRGWAGSTRATEPGPGRSNNRKTFATPARMPGAEPRREKDSCAREIITRLATQAFREPATAADMTALMALYEKGAAEGGFDAGVRMALEGILASPRFVFRFEQPPATARPGSPYRLSDFALASRLSFFLWATGPDEELLRAAAANTLSTEAGLEQQVRRMLADRRSDILATRFAAQWLRLQDLEKINPDVRFYPDFDDQLKAAMRRETELFFRHIVRDDRPILDVFDADYTFVDERLARHYQIPNVLGPDFRKVTYPDDRRRGVFGQGSILTLTSHADRTSPVLRGKWVMEVLLGTPPPPPPPNVPDLEATPDAEDGRFRTVRERMEQHRSNPACTSCHRMIDPIGLALENFDVTGAWRIKDNGMPVDTKTTLYDGTAMATPADLRQALLKRPGVLIQNFTENLMTFALGRRLEAADMSTVRHVVRQAAAADNRLSAFVVEIVKSPAFRMKTADPASTTVDGQGR